MSNKMQIGNITSGYRPIKNGDKYNRYFPKPDVKDRVIIEDGEVGQTVELMKKVVWKYIDDTKKIAPSLKGKTVAQSCDNIWNFLYHHIQYQLDKDGVEQLRRPARSWHERNEGIDCDCFSIFASSILTNLGIPHSFRITKYDSNAYQHVYVIVPIANRLHIIDPVLSKANYEKPYTQKKDFTMSIDGINVAVLSGPGDQDLYDAITASHLDGVGLGSMNEEQELNAIYKHLVATRNALSQNPEMISPVDDPKAFIQMLDYAIKYWNTPKREAALEALSRAEEIQNQKNGLSGIVDSFEEEEELLGRLFRRRKGRGSVKRFFSNIKKKLKNPGRNIKKALIRFNPLTLTARAGFLLAMKLNIKKMGSKLKWAYATQAQCAKHGISENQRQRSREALTRVKKLFVGKLYGKSSALQKAILGGKAGGLNGSSDLGDLGFIFTAGATAMIAAATPILIKTMKVLKSTGLMSKDESETIDLNHEQKQISHNTTSQKQTNSNSNTNSYVPTHNQVVTPNQDYGIDTAMNPPEEEKLSAKGIAFIKKNPMVAVGGVAVAAGIGYVAYNQITKKKKKRSSLKGVGKKKKRRKSKRSARKRGKSPVIKTIKLS